MHLGPRPAAITICPRNLYPIHIVSHYIILVITSGTYSTAALLFFFFKIHCWYFGDFDPWSSDPTRDNIRLYFEIRFLSHNFQIGKSLPWMYFGPWSGYNLSENPFLAFSKTGSGLNTRIHNIFLSCILDPTPVIRIRLYRKIVFGSSDQSFCKNRIRI